jgi:hypothetical protein
MHIPDSPAALLSERVAFAVLEFGISDNGGVGVRCVDTGSQSNRRASARVTWVMEDDGRR